MSLAPHGVAQLSPLCVGLRVGSSGVLPSKTRLALPPQLSPATYRGTPPIRPTIWQLKVARVLTSVQFGFPYYDRA